ncbi:MAG: hypothetical protein L3K19_02640 [Thermoplasmata archaeon]|nr:hypothetical protein [Thermoplasmata archaeon]
MHRIHAHLLLVLSVAALVVPTVSLGVEAATARPAATPAPLGNGPALAGPTSAPGTPPMNWSVSSSSVSPPKRAESMMVFDVADDLFLLFGGHSGNTLYRDTWKYTVGGGWTQLHPSVSPPARRGGSMIYDGVDHYVVLFGGSDYRQYLNDTWEFHAGKWTQLSPSTAPSPRRVAGVTYDVASRHVVLFGGHAGSLSVPAKYIFYNDTWTFRGGAWTQLQTPVAPAPRGEPTIVYDPLDGYILGFGGYNYHITFGDTWSLHGSVWTNLSSTMTLAPPARDGAGAAFDYNGSGVVMFGGHQGGAIFNDTWWYHAGSWSAVHPAVSPAKRGGVPLAWDRADGFGVIFGGLSPRGWLNDTWVLRA